MTTTGTRTFDCPWCGAISPVPADHMGEHFSCGECRKATKLTEKNTSTRGPTEIPPDAPHLTGDRTFDCPWCGAISSVPSSHLGEGFECPECKKHTKLTSTNTRRATVTAPPPDAPHDALGSGTGGGKALVAVAVLVLGGGAAWWFTAGPGGTPATETVTNTVVVTRDTVRIDVDRVKPPTVPVPGAVSAPVAPAMPTGVSPVPVPTGPLPEPTDGAEAARVMLAAKVAAADLKRATADASFEGAKAALEAWSKANPGALDAHDLLPALGETSAEIDRALADKALIPDPAKTSPDQVRAVDAAVRRFVEASPARARVAAAVLDGMRADRGGREVAGVADWKELHLTGDGFRRAAGTLSASWQALAGSVPADLVKALADAAAARDAAKAERDALTPPAGK